MGRVDFELPVWAADAKTLEQVSHAVESFFWRRSWGGQSSEQMNFGRCDSWRIRRQVSTKVQLAILVACNHSVFAEEVYPSELTHSLAFGVLLFRHLGSMVTLASTKLPGDVHSRAIELPGVNIVS